MEIQKTIWETHEVVVRYRPIDGEAYNKPLFEGSLEECEEYIRTCEVNE